MKKDAYYFSHDYNARKDPKCIALIKDFGMSGYGLYWCLIEVMYEQGGKVKKFPALFNALAHEFKTSEKNITRQIEAMLNKFELLTQDEKFIWSESVLDRLELRENKKYIHQETGRIGGIKSGEQRRKMKQNEGTLQQNEATLQGLEANEAKESKGKEIKEKEITVKEIREKETLFLWTEEIKKFFNDYIYKEKFCRDKNLSPPEYDKWLMIFINDLELREEFKELKELKSHFLNWYNSKIKSNGNRSNSRQAGQTRALANLYEIGEQEYRDLRKEDT